MAKHAKISSQSRHFFRIILPHILENGTLELPRYFVKENWKRLSKHARLKVPNGEKSKMKLKMSNGQAWLDKGWQDFVEKYKIKCGYFLVFRYEGRSRFNVQIFDLSTSEIEYPRTSQEKCKALLQIKEEDCVDDDDREMEVANQFRKSRSGQNSSPIKNKSRARDRVLQREKAFQSPNPHFIIIMKPSHVSRSNSGLWIPKDGRSYFRKKGNNKNMNLSLKGGDGRVWSMKFNILAPRRQVRIHYPGWTNFSQENNLQEGDICVFEVVNSMDVEFKVTIFRITDEEVDKNGPLANPDISSPRGKLSRQNSCSIKNKSLEISARDRVLQRAKAFQSPNPHFIVIMKPAFVSSSPYLHIPAGPAKSYFPKKGNKNIKLSLKGGDGRVWNMKNYIGASPKCAVRIRKGWRKFSQENNLQEGDICAFELVNSKTKEFKVTIFRITDEQVDKKDPLVPRGMKEIRNEMQTRKRKRGVFVKEYTTPLQRAKDCKCKEPSFTVMMRKSYLEDYCILLIPKDHASRYLIDQHGDEIFLHGLDGKTWPVKCYTSGIYYTQMTKFSYGWKDFVVDNNLQVGDACVFELLPHVSNHYKVTIFRVAE